jgi:hypothetical protein
LIFTLNTAAESSGSFAANPVFIAAFGEPGTQQKLRSKNITIVFPAYCCSERIMERKFSGIIPLSSNARQSGLVI